MNDAMIPDEPQQPEQGPESRGPATAGRMLREARERMHVDVAVLASMLKVPEHKLRALESDQLDQLPDLTFARALAASVCRTLQIDPAPVMALLPRASSSVGSSGHAPPINAPYRTQSESTVVARAGSVLQSRTIWVVFALLLAAVVLALLPNLDQLRLPGDGERDDAVASTPAADASAPVVAAEPASAPEPAASQAQAAASAAAPASAAASAVAASGDDLHLAATKDSWIQVRDASGKTLLSRTLGPGETLGLNGQPPYRIVIGNIEGLSLTVRGQPFDLHAVTKTTTARFEVP
jgi:cytoskeleton protein RodZ